ncbi:MAG: indolepyruvate ferredoxin oxidoreductase subunit alpha [Acidobacteria bacterium]|nr:MAG: indolepyruvate ferredoxin oxidoreductase subunit alpha [Acidobacteriota bacterium]
MAKEFLMGNEAIALGAIAAGVGVVTGYPGTPSSEILPAISKRNSGGVHVEWSVNEKVALEVAAGAALSGVRSMVTMKQVGLNVASDPLMSLAYIGVKGGMVVVVADDPGPISSQTEQDTRTFGLFSKLAVFDPASPEEAYEMIGDAFEFSERYGTPVIFRPTTRVCHGSAPVEVRESVAPPARGKFVKDSKWVIFPRLSYENHIKIEQRLPVMSEEFSGYRFNLLRGEGVIGIATNGISAAYIDEALSRSGEKVPAHKMLRVATPHPFPKRLGLEFLQGLERVLVVEELDPVIERELQRLAGECQIPVTVLGKGSGHIQLAGENTVDSVTRALANFFGLPIAPAASCASAPGTAPAPPARPPVLCAGCPHRASFVAVKRAMRNRQAVFSGDIGCYTLGNAKPLEMVDTCLCMSAGITIAQGLHLAEPDAVHFAFIGDSTFFHSGITGVINAVYNQTNIVLVVLDNSTTAMTGLQPHPGTGVTITGSMSEKIDIATLLRAIGVKHVESCDPLKHDQAQAAVTRAAAASANGVSALIFKSPCIQVTSPGPAFKVDREACKCKLCITSLGCPAMTSVGGKAMIDESLCTGCGLCAQICPFHAIVPITPTEVTQ